MATDEERDRVENTPSVDSTVDPAYDSTADSAPVLGSSALEPDALDPEPESGELEIDDPGALDRATEAVSDDDPGEDDLVEEPTDAELAELTGGADATAKAGEKPGDSNGELVGVGAATRSATRAKTAEQAEKKAQTEKSRTEKKGRATAKRDDRSAAHKRTGPVSFVKESVGELRKVVYPTGPQLLNYFVVVLIFVLFIIAIVSVLDLVFGWAILKIFS